VRVPSTTRIYGASDGLHTHHARLMTKNMLTTNVAQMLRGVAVGAKLGITSWVLVVVLAGAVVDATTEVDVEIVSGRVVMPVVAGDVGIDAEVVDVDVTLQGQLLREERTPAIC